MKNRALNGAFSTARFVQGGNAVSVRMPRVSHGDGNATTIRLARSWRKCIRYSICFQTLNLLRNEWVSTIISMLTWANELYININWQSWWKDAFHLTNTWLTKKDFYRSNTFFKNSFRDNGDGRRRDEGLERRQDRHFLAVKQQNRRSWSSIYRASS